MKYFFILVVSLAALLGLSLRSVEVLNRNYVFVYDQGLDMLAARSIAVDHKFTLIGAEAGGGFAGLPGIFHGPGYHYILAAISLVSHGDPYGEIVALWGIALLSIWFLYLIGNKLFGFWGGVTTGMLVLVSPAFIGMSRMIWAPNFAGLFIILYLYLLLIRSHKMSVGIFLLGLSASVLYNFEIPLAVAAILAAILYVVFVDRIKKLLLWAAFFAGSTLGFLPMLLFDARHGWLTSKGLIGFFLHPVIITKSAPFDFFGHMSVFLYHASGTFPSIPGLPYWFWMAAIALGVWLLRPDRKDKRRTAIAGLLLVFASHVLLFMPYRNPIYGHYLTILLYVYVLIGGYIVARLVERKQWIILGVFALVITIPPIMQYPKTTISDYHDYGGTAKIHGKIDAIDFIYKDAAGAPFGLLVFTPPVYTYPYDYVLQWYAKSKYGYLPTSQKERLFYLLIEKDPEKPWSYQGWLETVIKSGKIVASWTLPSGFIIQKRIMEP